MVRLLFTNTWCGAWERSVFLLSALAVCCKSEPRSDGNLGGTADARDSSTEATGSNGEAPDGASSGEGAASGATTGEVRITTNTVQPSELAPVPEGFELLYVTGAGVAASVDSMLVDEDTLYWGGGGLIWRAAKDGSGTPVTFADWENGRSSWLRADHDFLYWFDKIGLKRKRKDSTRIAQSPRRVRHNFPWGNDTFDFTYKEEIEVLDLGVRYSISHVDGDDETLFLAPTDCTPIHVIDLATFKETQRLAFERSASTGGTSSLQLAGSDLYCKNLYSLFAIGRDWANPRTLTTELQQNGALVAPRPASEGDPAVYILDYSAGGERVHLKAVFSSGKLDDFGESPVISGADSVSGVSHDAKRHSLAWMATGGGGDGFWLTLFDTNSKTYQPVRPLFDTQAFTSDANYYYWVGALKEAIDITIILRLPKDEAPRVAEAYAADTAQMTIQK